MKHTGARNFVASPCLTISREDPFAVVLYDAKGKLYGVARTWKEANSILEHAARFVPTADPIPFRVEAFFDHGAVVFPWALSRAHQLGCEVAGGAWEQGMRSSGLGYM